MKKANEMKTENGYTLMEILISILILIPIMGAAVSLFSTGAEQQASEQNSIDANQEARSALEMMSREIAQAGSHGDKGTVTTGSVSASSAAQALSIASAAGIMAGDWVDVDYGVSQEIVEVTAVGNNSITGIFRTQHLSGRPVRLFALPFTSGMIAPPGMAVNSSSAVTTLRFFGDINSDSTVQYVEYNYDSVNNQITRSITPVTLNTRNEALPLIRNLKPGSVQFMLNTDSNGIVTSANISFTVLGTWETVSRVQETELSTKIMIPSAVASSALLYENRRYGGVDRLPPTPAQVTAWTNE